MERIFITILSIALLSQSTFGQADTEKTWVTINNVKDVPVLLESGLKSSNTEFQAIIEAFDIIGVEKALPDSRNDELQKVYEVECNCDSYDLMAKMNHSSTIFSRAEEAPKYELLVTPNDYTITYSVDYALDNIDAQGAWNYTTGDSTIILGISDGNFYTSHPELQNKYVSTNTWTSPLSYYYHGTAVATTAAGATNNGGGKSAIGYDCMLDLKSMSYNSIIQLSNNGVRVINISWTSGCTYNAYVQMVMNEVHNNGTILVAAAGNGGTCGGASNLVYPAACDHVIAVTSVGPSDNHEKFIGNPASTHQHNSSVDLCAPGYDVALTMAPGWYTTGSGTSFAAPFVTGTIGLMLSLDPCLTSEEVEEILKITADDIDSINPNYIGGLGAGRLNAKAAVEYVAQNIIEVNPSHVSCFGLNDGSITLTNTQGSTDSYVWSSIDGSGLITSNENQTGLSSGTYDVIITDSNGCSVSRSVTLIEPAELIRTITVSLYSGGVNISCNGLSDATIDFDIAGGVPDYSYSWTTANGNGLSSAAEDQSGLSAGTYFITATDSIGCFVTDTITLVEPAALNVSSVLSTYPSADNISCNGLSDGAIDLTIAGGAPGYLFDWNTVDGSGLISTDEDQTGLSAGTYTVTTEDDNGCSTTSTFTLIEPPLLTVTIDVLSNYFGSAISCSGQNDGEISAEIQGGSPGYSSVWNTNPANSDLLLTGLSEGVYTITTTDANGCVALASEALLGNPMPLLNPDPEIKICVGEMVTFSANVGATETCSWFLSNGMELNQSGQNVLNLDDPGCIDAQLVVTNEFGCTDSVFLSNYICISANPIANFNASSYSVSTVDNLVNFDNQSYGASYYEWNFGDGTVLTGENVNHSFASNQPGDYSVVLVAYDANGCFDSTSRVIQLRDELLFYVPNSFTPDGDEFNNVFKPEFGTGFTPDDYSLMVYNRWGEPVFHSQDLFTGWDGTYNGDPVQQGTYSWTMILKSSDQAYDPTMKNTYQGHVNVLR